MSEPLIGNVQNRQTIETASRPAVARGWEAGVGTNCSRTWGLGGSGENVLELDRGGSCTTLNALTATESYTLLLRFYFYVTSTPHAGLELTSPEIKNRILFRPSQPGAPETDTSK